MFVDFKILFKVKTQIKLVEHFEVVTCETPREKAADLSCDDTFDVKTSLLGFRDWPF